jgi:diguanylate cyclase (GGDEF)-like protein/PAS domain S-box-containing protein
VSRAPYGDDAPDPAPDEAVHPCTAIPHDEAALPFPRPDGSSTVLFTCSLSGTVLAAGATLSELSGRPLPEVPGASVRALLHRSSHAKLEEVLQAVRDGAVSGSATVRLRHADGSAVRVRMSWAVLSGPDADSSQLVFLGTDTTDRTPDRPRPGVQEAFEQLSDDVAVVTDAQGTLLYASPAVGTLFGYEADDVVPSDVWSFIHPDDLPWARAGYQAVIDGKGSGTTTLRIRAAHGDWRWVKLVARLDDAVGGVVCAVHDISAEVEADRAVRASDAMFRAIAETSEEGIWVVGTSDETLYANTRLAAILGVSLDQTYDAGLMSPLRPQAAPGVRGRLRTHAGRGPDRYEVAYAHPDGLERRLWVSATPLRGEDGTREGSLAMISDVTHVRRAEEELRAAALHDSLTMLPNRTLFVDRLTSALARAKRSTALLLVDLDHFRMVNDSRGHGVGDRLLVDVGARLLTAVSGLETVARFGGDEFAVLCQDTDEHRAHAIARDVLEALTGPFRVDDADVHIAASIGVAVAPAEPAVSAADLLRHAGTALHAAKSAGRGRVQVFEQTLGEDMEHRFALAADLRAALADENLRLEFQPIVDLEAGTVVGMEALARWTHPEHGLVPPSMFVPVAELTGVAPALDRWVIRRALHEMAVLREAGVVPHDAYLAVNLSACSLTEGFVLDDLQAWTEDSGLCASQLVLEITETAIMQNTGVAVRLLRCLRDQGFRVAMDDFGTGYSSLAYLRDLPISALKIDRSFVADITEQQDALAIVASIIDLARAVGVDVVAEGVETPEQAALLRRLGCVTAQGWLWSPAVSLRELLSGPVWMSPSAIARATAGPRTPGREKRGTGLADGLRKLLDLPRTERTYS